MSTIGFYKAIVFSVLSVTCFTQGDKNRIFPVNDPDRGGLNSPDGSEAIAMADQIGFARYAVNTGVDICVKRIRIPDSNTGNVSRRVADGDGKADRIVYFGLDYPIHSNDLTPGKWISESEMEIILTDDHETGIQGYEYITKAMTFDTEGNMNLPYGTRNEAMPPAEKRLIT